MESEEWLIGQAKVSEEHFVRIYRKYVRGTYRYFLLRLGNKSVCEDLTSESWERILKGIKGFRGTTEASLRAWIFMIVRHVFCDFLKKRRRRECVSIDEWGEFLVSGDLIQGLKIRIDEEGCLKEIRKVISELPDKQREVICLKYMSGFKNKEIAVIMKVSEKTVASNLSRALGKVREAVIFLKDSLNK